MCVYCNSSKSEVKRTKKIGYSCGGTDPGNEKSQEEQCTRSREHGFRLDQNDQGSQVGEIHIKGEINFFIGVLLLYNIGFVFAVQQSESAMHIYIYIYPLFLGFPSHLGHHRTKSRVPCALQLVLTSYLLYLQQPTDSSLSLPTHPTPHLLLILMFVFYICVSISAL